MIRKHGFGLRCIVDGGRTGNFCDVKVTVPKQYHLCNSERIDIVQVLAEINIRCYAQGLALKVGLLVWLMMYTKLSVG